MQAARPRAEKGNGVEMPPKQQQLIDDCRRAYRAAQGLVVINGFKQCRDYVINIYGGICEGVQAMLFNDSGDAQDYILQSLCPFYRQLGKRVRLHLA